MLKRGNKRTRKGWMMKCRISESCKRRRLRRKYGDELVEGRSVVE